MPWAKQSTLEQEKLEKAEELVPVQKPEIFMSQMVVLWAIMMPQTDSIGEIKKWK